MKFYLLAALLFVAMLVVTAAPAEDHLFDSSSNAVEGRAGRHARTSCTIAGRVVNDWLCKLSCIAQGKGSGQCKGDFCHCK
ncbi:defensin [Vespula squamosa]|uniref:Defensin n=1 Tax=Vespula squamosa TaxID=30214 RepID=A0ABD2AQ80_VESSQ